MTSLFKRLFISLLFTVLLVTTASSQDENLTEGLSTDVVEQSTSGAEEMRIREIQQRQEEMLRTVAFAQIEKVGNGTAVAVYSGMRDGEWHNYLLTACHVVDAAVSEDAANEDKLVETTFIHHNDFGGRVVGSTTYRTVIAFCDKDSDVALLRALQNETGLPDVARMMEQGEHPMMTEEIWNVGFGKGVLQATEGRFSNPESGLKGNFAGYVVSAEGINGNSGGGVYRIHSERYELIGIVTGFPLNNSVYPHPAVQEMMDGPPPRVPVSHMTIVIPMEKICGSMRRNGYGFICDDEEQGAQ